jgi:hypothetical protein
VRAGGSQAQALRRVDSRHQFTSQLIDLILKPGGVALAVLDPSPSLLLDEFDDLQLNAHGVICIHGKRLRHIHTTDVPQ